MFGGPEKESKVVFDQGENVRQWKGEGPLVQVPPKEPPQQKEKTKKKNREEEMEGRPG